MKAASPKKKMAIAKPLFGQIISTEQLTGLAAELQKLRSYPPLTKRADGKYEGDILGFVKGLRLSARVIYYLRERLAHTNHEVSWGHLVDSNEQSCSPECDIIIHKKGHIRKWNGGERPVMEFKFVRAEDALTVVSCKSLVNSIDKDYPKDLKKYGVNNVVLFGECCSKSRFKTLRDKARQLGYKDLFVLYFTDDEEMQFAVDENLHARFGNCICKLLPKDKK